MENREPELHELSQMERIVEDAMQQGAFGLSTGLIYPPDNYTETNEIIALYKVISRYR